MKPPPPPFGKPGQGQSPTQPQSAASAHRSVMDFLSESGEPDSIGIVVIYQMLMLAYLCGVAMPPALILDGIPRKARMCVTFVEICMPEYHIAEWYGRPFDKLSPDERVALARHRVTKPAINRQEIDRLLVLRDRSRLGGLSEREQERYDRLEAKLEETISSQLPCPFKTGPYQVCNKKNGVCSLRLYDDVDGDVVAVAEERGKIRALCPYRLHQDGIAFRHVGEMVLGDPEPALAGEVGFLEGDGGLDAQEGADVGRIDMIMVKTNSPSDHPMEWCAAEVQAVYFSGDEMGIEQKHIIDNFGALTLPAGRRRPDYRSSGVKRLMPQLQTKIPSLRRWGRKMAVIVDQSFFANMGEMRRIEHLSNADIAWVLLDFAFDVEANIYRAHVADVIFVTLESAIDGLTGGRPVSKEVFEARIRAKIDH